MLKIEKNVSLSYPNLPQITTIYGIKFVVTSYNVSLKTLSRLLLNDRCNIKSRYWLTTERCKINIAKIIKPLQFLTLKSIKTTPLCLILSV